MSSLYYVWHHDIHLIIGLRKLEAFFGFLITIMAVSFGYEVSLTSINKF